MLEHSLLYVMCVKMRAVTPTERDQILPLQSTFVQKCTSSDDPPNPAQPVSKKGKTCKREKKYISIFHDHFFTF